MKAYIAGKPLLSTTDWPSMVCCVVFFIGCNFRCRYCFNGPLLTFNEKYFVELSQIYPEIKAHQYLIDGVMVTGGEPTLQPDALYAVASWVHQNQLRFGLMTNGTRPDVIRYLLSKKLVDYVALDIKTKPDPAHYGHVTQTHEEILSVIKESVSLLKTSDIHYEFRTTLVPNLVNELNHILKIIKWVGKNNYVLQVFRPTDTVVDEKFRTLSFKPEEIEQFRIFAQKHRISTRFATM